MLKELFGWFDTHPGSYWVIAALASALLAGWTGFSFSRKGRSLSPRWHAVGTGLLLLAALFAWRWPALLRVEELNPDESQLIAGAITLKHDPIFWRSVDGTTSGPVNFYALLPTHWLGIPQDFFNARLTGLLLVWGALWAGYGLLRREYGTAIALLGLLPGLAFFATATDSDFIHYSSEHVSLLLLMLSAWLLRTSHLDARLGQRHPRISWLGAGLFMGMLPWAKLQSAPIAAALAAWGTWLALQRTDLPWKLRCREVSLLALAALTPSVCFLALVIFHGQWVHFYRGYIENNIIYVNTELNALEAIAKMYRLSSFTGTLTAFLVSSVVFLPIHLLSLIACRRRPGPLFWSGFVLTIAALIAVLTPRQGFPHYLLFLVPPLTWWCAAALGDIFATFTSGSKRLALGLAFALIGVGIPIANRVRHPGPPMFGHFLESWLNPYSEPARLVRRHRQPGDSLAVWGWDCQIYVETRLTQATREAHSTRQLWASSQRDTYYRPRYMTDLKASFPAFFIDAVGPEAFFFGNRAESAHETFPELRDYIAEHYVLLEDFERSRVYLRKDRWEPEG